MIDWDKEKKLGILGDSELAYKHGVQPSVVREVRLRRGISKAPSCSKIRMQHDIDWEQQPLGEASDSNIANQLGCSASTVRYHRMQLGIEPFCSPDRNGNDWKHLLLLPNNFHLSHQELATKYGVTRQTVEKARLAMIERESQ